VRFILQMLGVVFLLSALVAVSQFVANRESGYLLLALVVGVGGVLLIRAKV